MTNSIQNFIAAELDRRFAQYEDNGAYAMEASDCEELRNYPAIDSAMPAMHKNLGDGYVLFDGLVGGTHVILFQAANIDRDRAGRCGRFVAKHGVAGYVTQTLKDVCDFIGDTDVVERAIDSYLLMDAENFYAANPGVLEVDRPTASTPVSAPVPVLERKRAAAAQRAVERVTLSTEDVKDDFCPEWMRDELGEAWSDYETFGDF